MNFRNDIQGLRALAVSLVVLFHAGLLFRGGFVGVDVFFVISGFVISNSISRQVEVGEFSPISFLLRRVRRLLPALGILLTVIIALSSMFATYGARLQTIRTGLFASFSMSNIFLYRFRPQGYFESEEKANALLHTWSLSIEEQFFFFLAIAVVIATFSSRKYCLRRSTTLWLIGVTLGSISLLSCVLISFFPISELPSIFSTLLGPTKVGPEFAFFMPFTRAWQFLLGVLAGATTPRISQKIKPVLGGVGLFSILTSAYLFSESVKYPGIYAVVPSLGALLLIWFLPNWSGLHNFFSHKMLCWIGNRSYSIYLWHWPLIQFLKPIFPNSGGISIFAVLLSLGPAALSYQFVEQPIRQGSAWSSRRRAILILGFSVLFPSLAFISSRSLSPELNEHLDRQIGCEFGAEYHVDPEGPCSLASDESGDFALLVGDSHAGMISEAFVHGAHSNHLTAVLAVETGRPFTLPIWSEKAVSESPVSRILDQIERKRPAVVVVAQSVWSLPSDVSPGFSWKDTFYPVLERLRSLRIPVVIASTTYFPYGDPLICSHFQTLIGRCPAEVILDLNQSLGDAASKIIAERELGVEFGAVVFDMSKSICPNRVCMTRRGGKWWWRDRTHISIFASEYMGPDLSRAIAEAIEKGN